MELVAGEPTEQILAQPLLEPMFRYLQESKGLDLAHAQQQASYLREELEKFYKRGTVTA